ncbi:DOPA 4,5-dioxygenase family protein [Vibrio ostreicida]|uniref:DOPA 4,5-dioxygenase family protein n=1 Tax=Vibrio ostreicida TaxID=526588 RepID=A0ABT8BUX7_9VIBR|nr:DOPA 4,5-dioxygenase family protein [Vibrio ostreicida]MDN3610191.1 DOPA 4,5-dioxygenase family protein [Vibrio ostreicida]NPD07788.1 DOPA 4,5-dioxygenase family protein [Vibrio ostreicida]
MAYPKNTHSEYHAHVYFDEATTDFSAELREQLQGTFSLSVGPFNQRPVGPHTMWSFSITFSQCDFEWFIPWLDHARGRQPVLVHAVTGDDINDHTLFAYWLGQEVDLDLTVFPSR